MSNTTPDQALARALDRWLPGTERHEIEAIRVNLRAYGFDVCEVVQPEPLAAPAISRLCLIAEEIHTAGDQLAALTDDLELWQTDMETDLLGLRLKMAEWTRLLCQACGELAL